MMFTISLRTFCSFFAQIYLYTLDYLMKGYGFLWLELYVFFEKCAKLGVFIDNSK